MFSFLILILKYQKIQKLFLTNAFWTIYQYLLVYLFSLPFNVNNLTANIDCIDLIRYCGTDITGFMDISQCNVHHGSHWYIHAGWTATSRGIHELDTWCFIFPLYPKVFYNETFFFFNYIRKNYLGIAETCYMFVSNDASVRLL